MVSDRVRGGKGCVPISQPGWLSIDAKTELPVWNTFDQTDSACATSRLVADLHAHAFDASNVLSGADHLKNKTVLIISDLEPTRRRLMGLCDILGGTRGAVDAAHPWGRALKHPGRGDGLTLGTYCYLPSQDLLLHQFPHGGLTSASSLEFTVKSVLPPFLSSLASQSPLETSPLIPPPRKSALPDLTVWSSYEADVRGWIRADAAQPAAANAIDAGGVKLAAERLNRWRESNVRILKALDGVLSSLGNSRNKGRALWQSGGYGDVDIDRLASSGSSSDIQPLPALSAALHSLLQQSGTTLARLSSFHGELEWKRISEQLSFPASGPAATLSEGPAAAAPGAGAGAADTEALQLARVTSERRKRESALWGEMILGALKG
ncbi:hypothetical protein BCV69DRAFT_284630 [Microstroma glucosiphilum]|uniref:Uncharacterized protein n=1 Tax=Pseudomicrostroma glucosiphilum TaxID=1684307 RepID=A0A316U0V3_9BASI|nr:hypothetical protein BCV69DRAFT_284630 [Pseudomicrostroma glucosiphilum]PWN19032.1 hypothetical protein BCV69DRAFT_284630 [Pseudomicrostroma glucosiphilum]